MTNNNTKHTEINAAIDLIDTRINELGETLRREIAKLQDAYSADHNKLTAERRDLCNDLDSLYHP